MEATNQKNTGQSDLSSEKDDKTQNKPTVAFFKPPNRKGNIRKRKAEDEGEDETKIVRKEKTSVGVPLVQSTKDIKRTKEDLSWESSRSAVPAHTDQLATATIETETERDRDATAIRTRDKGVGEILVGDEAVKVYRGNASYTDYLPVREQSGLAKGTGIKAGPIRGAIHHRAISRMDYQPDVCKDYKDTGYCGFGDSCKFLHDRGDYKSSFEIEKEWEEEQKLKKAIASGEAAPKEPDEDLPFACSICRGPFVDPVVTKCKHFFCERCALQLSKCAICGENTNRAFRSVTATERTKLEKSRKQFEERNVEDAATEQPT